MLKIKGLNGTKFPSAELFNNLWSIDSTPGKKSVRVKLEDRFKFYHCRDQVYTSKYEDVEPEEKFHNDHEVLDSWDSLLDESLSLSELNSTMEDLDISTSKETHISPAVTSTPLDKNKIRQFTSSLEDEKVPDTIVVKEETLDTAVVDKVMFENDSGFLTEVADSSTIEDSNKSPSSGTFSCYSSSEENIYDASNIKTEYKDEEHKTILIYNYHDAGLWYWSDSDDECFSEHYRIESKECPGLDEYLFRQKRKNKRRHQKKTKNFKMDIPLSDSENESIMAKIIWKKKKLLKRLFQDKNHDLEKESLQDYQLHLVQEQKKMKLIMRRKKRKKVRQLIEKDFFKE